MTIESNLDYSPKTGIEKALAILGRHFKQKAIAQALDTTEANISRWKKLGVVPSKHCARFKLLTGGKVTLHELNPADFPLPDHLLLSCDKDALAQAGYCVESLAVLRPKLATNKHAA